MKCPKCNNDEYWTWRPSVNEEGWDCMECGNKPGEPPGYSPVLDRSHTHAKVAAILLDLHDGGFYHVSNGTMGDMLADEVAEMCTADNTFDQHTIICRLVGSRIIEHSQYWQEIATGVLTGKDIRRRCPCGKLATSYSGDKARCSDHAFDEDLEKRLLF